MHEPIVSVSSDNGKTWHEEWPCKPGKLTRRPCFNAPYHYRLDWNIWFLGFKPHQQMLQQREGWLYVFLEKVLSGQEAPLRLLDAESAELLRKMMRGKKRSKLLLAKVEMYRYRMSMPLWEICREWYARYTLRQELKSSSMRLFAVENEEIVWWRREFEESLVPIVRVGKDGRLERWVEPSS